ncbi:MAG: YbaB/EbfC family nucleoid-associated protein [Alphaproteobacteria bacterium]
MKDFGSLMKQMQELQGKMGKLQEDLGRLEIEGVSGGGLVRVTLSGKGELKGVKIDPTILQPSDAEMIEDLLIAAHNDAKKKTEERVQQETQSVFGGLPLPPGFKLPV